MAARVTGSMLGSWPSSCAATISPIYHGENGVRTLKELARSYLTITKDLTRVMSRIKAVYRSWPFPVPGQPCIERAIVRNGRPRLRNVILSWYSEHTPDQFGFTGNPLGPGFTDEGVGLFLDGYYGPPPNLTWGQYLPFFKGK